MCDIKVLIAYLHIPTYPYDYNYTVRSTMALLETILMNIILLYVTEMKYVLNTFHIPIVIITYNLRI